MESMSSSSKAHLSHGFPVHERQPCAGARINEAMSKDALRVLAVGYKEIAQVPEELKAEELEIGLMLMGLLGMIDPRARKRRKRWQHAAKRASSQ